MRTTCVLTVLLVLALASCSDGGGEADASGDRLCVPGALRCDELRPTWLQQCSPDGSSWVDLYECEMCHDGTCYGRLDASG
jgi:hypothetical protein